MKQIILRNVPDELHKALKHLAIERDTSLQKLIVMLLEDLCKKTV